MANFGFIRRDLAAGNRIRLGITSYLLIFIVVFLVAGYLFLRMSGFGPSMLSTDSGPKEDPNAIPTNVGTVANSLSLWQPNALNSDGDPFTLAKEEKKDTLSTQTAVFAPITGSQFTGSSGGSVVNFSTSGLEQLTGDDGGLYVKTNFGVFSLNVVPGTILTGKKNTSYVVGDDRQLYQVMQGGKRIPLSTAPEYKLKDKVGRFYTVSKNLQLRLHTPGPKGRFIGPDNKAYEITRSGDIEDVKTQDYVSAISGEGEFTGSDDEPYVVMQGLLFSKAPKDVSFGSSVMTGTGYFKGPDGKTYLRGEDGKIYLVGEDGKLTPSSIGGTGTFTGPDGATYYKDENGDIRKLVGSGINGESQKTSLSKGYFIGPDGKKYYVDENGKIFSVNPDGSLTPSKIGGSGTFVGPDGKLYTINEKGEIVPVAENAKKLDNAVKGKYLVGPDGKRYYVDKDGRTFLIDENGNRIPAKLPAGVYRDVDGNTYTVDSAGNITSKSNALPSGTYTDQYGNKYYVDENGRTYKVMPDGSLVEVDKLPEGTVLTNANGEAFRIQADGSAKREGGSVLASGSFIGPDGKRYFKDKNGKLFKVEADGSLTPVDKLTKGTFIGPDGALYHSDGSGNITKLSDSDTATVPKGYFYGPDGKLYYSDENGKLYAVGENGKLTPVDKLPAGAFVGPDGKTYYSDGNGNISVQGGTTNDATLPEGTFVGPDGATYMVDKNGKLYRINPDGSRTPVSKLPAGTFVGPDGATYMVDENGRITKVSDQQRASTPAMPNVFGVLEQDDLFGGMPVVANAADPSMTKRSASVNISENLNNFNTGKDFEPNEVAKQLKGGRVYTLAKQEPTMVSKAMTPEEKAAAERAARNFFPVGTRIPFYLLTHVSSKTKQGGLIEGVVAENVFFHDKAIPAGTRLYGKTGDEPENNRYQIDFTMLQFPNGKSVSLSADAYDVNMEFGLEAYYTPPPAWTTALKALNVGAIHELNKDVGRSSEGEQLGDTDEVTEYLEELVDEIIHKQTGYYTLPAGTPGVLMLTADLELKDISYHGGDKRAEKSENLMKDKELTKALEQGSSQAYNRQIIGAANAGVGLEYGYDTSSKHPTGERRLQIATNSAHDQLKQQYLSKQQQALGNAQQQSTHTHQPQTTTKAGASSGADLSNIFKQ